MIYELKITDKPGGLQVKERYKTLAGETFETAVLISTALAATLVTTKIYSLLSDEPLTPMEKNLNYGIPYIPTIPNPQRGLIKGFMLGGKLYGDIPVIVCDCEIGYSNNMIYGSNIILKKCRRFSVDRKMGKVIIET